ncbi:hypothetical protein [Hymenobacter persicinus]|uniref:Uncharacterized protein n=1 Tax=Hymenobacter persicinus TaxID=2025506 RepID=A0A4V1ZAG1_9BACT|nr:hypothetical protein [Hymenobacter persicinus]RYU77976.1 hypothetical protein EWM57_15920 [Hymenobacter persicinus]
MSTRLSPWLLTGLLAALPLGAVWAQTQPAMLTQQQVHALAQGYYTPYEYNRTVEKAALTPEQAYFTPDWQTGTLWTAGGEKHSVAALRYNIALRLVEVRDPTTPAGVSVLPVGGLRGFTLGAEGKRGSHTFETRTVGRSADSRNFFETLTAGPLQLFLLHTIDEKAANWIAAYNIETRPASVSRGVQLFAGQAGQGAVQELALKRKSVEKLFGAQAPQVAAYAAEKKLDYEQVPDLVMLVDYFNSLAKTTQP